MALLAALLTAFAVIGSSLPILLESDYRFRALHEQTIEAALAGAAVSLSDPAQLMALVERTPLSGAMIRRGDLVRGRVGRISEVEEVLLRACSPTSPGEARVVHLDEGVGGCVRLNDDAGELFAFAPDTDLDRTRRRRQLVVLTLAFASLAAGILGGAMQRLLDPLSRITEQARRLATGAPGASVEIQDADLLPLAAALRQLSAALASREDDIQQRLDLTRQLAAVVAHEVRNPLQSLTMLADVVAHSDDPVERQELLRSIQQELGLIEVVVQRLVGSGDTLRLVRRPTSLWSLIGRCVRLQTPQAREAGVELETELLEAAEGELDGPLLRRAIENLVRNAITALSAQGGGRVRVSLERDGELARVHVDDDGPGIPPEDREQIFRSGISGRPGGTGLGLPLARRVAEAHGGSLTVADAPLGGARFTLTLPLKPPAEETSP